MNAPAQTTDWYVITGAPCSGKTAVIRQLEKMGYAVVHVPPASFAERTEFVLARL